MQSFPHLRSTVRLQELALELPDLTDPNILDSRRIESMTASASSLKLMYATERVSEVILNALFDLADECHLLAKMQQMQSGEIVNNSEKRPALHTATRDFFESPNSSPVAAEATKLAYQELEKLKEFLFKLNAADKFSDLVQIGIGGSELGPKAIYLALKAFRKPGRRVHFLSNVDPDDAASLLQKLDLSKTLIVNVSKSGTTLETLTNEEFLKQKLQEAGLRPKEHMIAVTAKGSPMDDASHYLEVFYIWDYIGGRYSVTSMVGAVGLAFAFGMDRFLDFLRGASAMDKVALGKDVKKNLPLLSALLGVWNRNFLDLPVAAVIPYSFAMSRFPTHLQQLDMESNGKSVDKSVQPVDYNTGPIVWGEVGTNSQHSFFQSIHQGTTLVPVEFIGFKESQYRQDVLFEGTSCQQKLLSNLFAQSLALASGQHDSNPNKNFSGNRPSRILLAERLEPFTVGSILAYFEHKVVFQGFLWNINSFDQEGVQLGKKLAGRFLDLFVSKKEGSELNSFPVGEAFLSLLDF